MIDEATLRSVPARLGRRPRVLDVACGTGIVLKHVLEQVPDVEAYGVDASADMLAQARAVLKGQPNVQLEQYGPQRGWPERASLTSPVNKKYQ